MKEIVFVLRVYLNPDKEFRETKHKTASQTQVHVVQQGWGIGKLMIKS